jgi:hypothetical protein
MLPSTITTPDRQKTEAMKTRRLKNPIKTRRLKNADFEVDFFFMG